MSSAQTYERDLLDALSEARSERLASLGRDPRVLAHHGRSLYPTFQFDGGRIVPQISEVAALFRHTPVDGWAVASCFTTPAAAPQACMRERVGPD